MQNGTLWWQTVQSSLCFTICTLTLSSHITCSCSPLPSSSSSLSSSLAFFFFFFFLAFPFLVCYLLFLIISLKKVWIAAITNVGATGMAGSQLCRWGVVWWWWGEVHLFAWTVDPHAMQPPASCVWLHALCASSLGLPSVWFWAQVPVLILHWQPLHIDASWIWGNSSQ
jgi:hypothetical protein